MPIIKSKRDLNGKTCTKCLQWFPYENYHKSSKEKDGRVQKCKPCLKRWAAEHYKTHRERILDVSRRWWTRNKEKVSAYAKAWYEKNRDRLKPIRTAYAMAHRDDLRENSRVHYQANRPEILQRCKRYRKDRPEVQRAAWMRRRYREMAGEGVTAKQIDALRVQQGDSCFYCHTGLSGNGEIEHKTPVSRGGEHSIRNVVLSCQPCNRRKGMKTAEEFMGVAFV